MADSHTLTDAERAAREQLDTEHRQETAAANELTKPRKQRRKRAAVLRKRAARKAKGKLPPPQPRALESTLV